MHDSILDDVDELLLKDGGDRRILEQIRRAAENNEVISVSERNYVAKLRGEFIDKRPEPGSRRRPARTGTGLGGPLPAAAAAAAKPRRWGKKPRRKKIIILGAAAVVLAAILASGVSLSGFDPAGTDPGTPAPAPAAPVAPADLSIKTDAASYASGDIISISGNSGTQLKGEGGDRITLTIENPGNELTWTENAGLKPGGAFSTLVIAGGPGWDEPGTYRLTAEYGGKSESLDFGFTG